MKGLYATDGGRPAIEALVLFVRVTVPDKGDVNGSLWRDAGERALPRRELVAETTFWIPP